MFFSAFMVVVFAIISFIKDGFNKKAVLGALTAVLSVIVVVLFQHLNFLTFTISTKEFEEAFPVSISDFIFTKGDNTIVEGNVAFVKKKKDGSVIIKMSHEQNKKILAICAQEIAKSRSDDIYISTSFDEICVNLYRENLIADTVTAASAMNKLYLYQFFSDPQKKAEEIYVKYVWIDGATGKELYSRSEFVDEDVKEFHITEEELSSKWNTR
ncbi:MAG: hypothetical protein IJA44_01255 [Clostridia bacterium]|nr:hypothetical protein [Clostridia bacterium]